MTCGEDWTCQSLESFHVITTAAKLLPCLQTLGISISTDDEGPEHESDVMDMLDGQLEAIGFALVHVENKINPRLPEWLEVVTYIWKKRKRRSM